MQWDRDNHFEPVVKTATGHCRTSQMSEDFVEFRTSILKTQYHIPQGGVIYTGPRDLIEMNLPALTIRTGPFDDTVSACVSPAAPTVITACAIEQMRPALSAQSLIGFTYTLNAIDTNRRPEQVIEPSQPETETVFYR